jgi:hypothetical protein
MVHQRRFSDFDSYEGVTEDPWVQPASTYLNLGDRWDEDEPPPEHIAFEMALDLATHLEQTGCTSVSADELRALFDQAGSIVDFDQTRYLTDPPHPVIVLDLEGIDDVLVVAFRDAGPGRDPSWVIRTWEDQQAEVHRRENQWRNPPDPGREMVDVSRGSVDTLDPTAASPETAREDPGGTSTDGSGGRPLERGPDAAVQLGPWLERLAAAQYLDVEVEDLDSWVDVGLLRAHLLPDGRERFSTKALDDLLRAAEPVPPIDLAGDRGRDSAAAPHRLYGFDVFDLGTRNDSVRTFTEDHCQASIHSFLFSDESSIEVSVEVVRARSGEAWVRAAEVDEGLEGLGRLLHGGRLGIRRFDESESIELAQMQFTDFPWSGLRRVGWDELEAGAGNDVRSMLLRHGATRVGTREELESCTHQRRNYLAAHFPRGDDEIPALAFILTRVVPLVRAELAMRSA